MASEGNGHRAERKLLEYLEQLGFRLRRSDEALDERDKTDVILEAPPLLHGEHFFLSPIAVQITLRREDVAKRRAFVTQARRIANRLVYLELMVNEVTPAVAHAAAAALASFFFDDGPRYRLLLVGENVFEAYDLEEENGQEWQWLEACLPGMIRGRVVRWDHEGQFGFILATVNGPDGTPTEIEFYMNARQIRDEHLRAQLDERSGGRLRSKRQISVVFQDGGIRDGQRKKNAHNVRLASSVA